MLFIQTNVDQSNTTDTRQIILLLGFQADVYARKHISIIELDQFHIC
jgi:hypothetical protein